MTNKPYTRLLKKISSSRGGGREWFLVLFFLLFSTAISYSQILSPYVGGNSGSQSLAEGNFSTCTLPIANTGTGGNDDGHNSVTLINNGCNVNPYVGGNAGGQSLVVGNFAICTLPIANTGIGGNDDGHISANLTNVACNSNVYSGGSAGGQSLAIGSFAACTLPLANVDIGGSNDGNSWDSSGCVAISNTCTMVVTAGSNVSICYGASTTLNASVTGAVGTPTYVWSPVTYLSDPNISNPVSSALSTADYTVTITDDVCTKAASVRVTVNPMPAAVAGSNRIICSGQSTILGAAAVAGDTYSWVSSPAGFTSTSANPAASPTVSTNYTLTETITFTGCINTNSVSVTVNPLPVADAGTNKSVCAGASTTIGSAAVAGSTYLWSPATALSSTTVANPTASPTVSTTYTLTETITSTGCQKSNTVTVTAGPLPAANTGSNKSICLGTSTTIGAAAVAGDTYSWISSPAGFTSTSANPSVSPAATTTYILTETVTVTGCANTNSVIVWVNSVPGANAGSNQSICYGGNTSIGAAPVAGSTYLWTPSTALSSTTVSNPNVTGLTLTTDYTLIETITATGCQQSGSVRVTVYSPVAINPATIAICGSTTTVTLGATGGSGTATYVWAAGGQTTQNISVGPTVTTSYTLTLTDAMCGVSVATSTVTNTGVCVQQNVFMGGSDDGHIAATLTNVQCNPALYAGGNAGGQNLALGNFSACTLPISNTATGGNDDGHSYAYLTNVQCNPALYAGGNAGGQNLALGNFSACTLPISNTATGGNDDGHTYAYLTNVQCNPLLYAGGNAGGQNLALGSFSACTLPIANVAPGGTDDGHTAASFTVCASLPIELLSFTATLLPDEEVRCEWETVSENNNDYFTIEKTKDDIHYVFVGNVKGAGNSNIKLYYELIDPDPYQGISYYRLKQTDYDGNYTYSNLVPINLTGGDILNIYPNPARNEFVYEIGSAEKMTLKVQVMNMLGQVVINKIETIEKGITQNVMNVAGLSSGTYSLQIVTENNEVKGKQFQIIR